MKTKQLFVLMSVLALFPAASFADTRAGGEDTTANITLDTIANRNTDFWETLEMENFTLASTSQCIVVACSDVDNPGPTGSVSNNYNFTIGFDTTEPGMNTPSERSLEMNDSADDNDPASEAVCSTRYLPSVPAGAHNIFWLGARASSADAITTVLDSSMTVACFDGSAL